MVFDLPGIKSVLPAKRGIQKLWQTSADNSVIFVRRALASLLTGMWSSLAVMTGETVEPSVVGNPAVFLGAAIAYSHHHWWPTTVTCRAVGSAVGWLPFSLTWSSVRTITSV